MADQNYSKETEPEGVLHPSAHAEKVEAPPLTEYPKRAPKSSTNVHVDDTGCADVTTPEDPTFKGARY